VYNAAVAAVDVPTKLGHNEQDEAYLDEVS
jgi:hypothetical protein